MYHIPPGNFGKLKYASGKIWGPLAKLKEVLGIGGRLWGSSRSLESSMYVWINSAKNWVSPAKLDKLG